MFDSHVHTAFSVDSKMPIEDAIRTASNKGLGIVITDHMDINDYKQDTFIFDVDDFFKTYSPLRSDKVLLGIEMGFRKEAAVRNQTIVDAYEFDFILGSVHTPYATTNPYEYCDDENFQGLSRKDAYAEYFKSMLAAIRENPYFDSLGHIDYIARYSPYDDRSLYYDEQKAGIDAVLKELVYQGKSMEINTKIIQQGVTAKELLKIYKQFRAFGGETLTFGSDSHVADTLGKDFKLAMSMAEACGLKPVYYKKRQRVYL